VNRDVDLFENV